MQLRKINPWMSAIGLLFLVFLFKQPKDTRQKNVDLLIKSAYVNSGSIPDSELVVYQKVSNNLDRLADLKKPSTVVPVQVLYMPFGAMQVPTDNASTNDQSLKSFFVLKGLALQPNTKIGIDKGEYYLESSTGGDQNTPVTTIRSDRKKLNARLSYLNPGDNGLTLLVPVSNSSYKWIKTITDILFWLGVIAILWVAVFVSTKVFKNIAEGKPFLSENSKYLSWLGSSILIVALSYVLLPFLIRLFFLSNIPDEVYYPFWSWLYDVKWGLLAGLAVLGIAQAFKHGNQIQKEQDLTI
jgi:hypothetical protein